MSRIVAETPAGRFELLPRRLDCIAALAPGILRYETPMAGPAYLALDEGVLIKAGALVLVSVRRAIEGVDLAELQRPGPSEFPLLDEQERRVRASFARAESGLRRRLAEFQRER